MGDEQLYEVTYWLVVGKLNRKTVWCGEIEVTEYQHRNKILEEGLMGVKESDVVWVMYGNMSNNEWSNRRVMVNRKGDRREIGYKKIQFHISLHKWHDGRELER